MTIYAGRDADGFVVVQVGLADAGGMGPPSPPPDGPYDYVPVAGRVSGVDKPSPTSKLRVVSGSMVWVEAAALADSIAATLAQIDAESDAARLAVVGDAARIKEYERAQAGAEAYRDAGFAGPVPSAVASWAYAKRRQSWTARQAAEDILAASSRWYAALDGIRALRLDAKESARAAQTTGEVATVAANFRTTLTAAMQGVQ